MTKKFYEVNCYIAPGDRPNRYELDEWEGEVLEPGIVLLRRRHGITEVRLEASLADTPEKAFALHRLRRKLEVEEKRHALRRAEEELEKSKTAERDWREQKPDNSGRLG
jgi:hypothetical protein